MPQLEKKLIKYILDRDDDDYKIFVETGTYRGDTIISMESLFDELHTIEILEDLYNLCKNKIKNKKINFYLGDSSTILKDICIKLKNNAIFFLDGHYSGNGTGRGDKDCPLYEELQSIMNNFKHNSIVIIDDCRDFGKKHVSGNGKIIDWSKINLSNILEITQKRRTEYYFLPSSICEDDRIVLKLSK